MYCYCCSGKAFTECCEPYLSLAKSATDCESLMRSRYSAYCLADTTYLVSTLHPSQRHAGIAEDITEFAKEAHFCHLTIHSTMQTAEQGQVNFAAYFLHQQKLDVIKEVSDFVYDGRWYYTSGQLQKSEPQKIGRNDTCPCGSGKKFKQCSTHLLSGQLTDKPFLCRLHR